MGRVLKYNEAKQKIIQYVGDNQLKTDDKLPAEHELCALLGMSNMPVRQALGELQNCGVLRKVKGVGTFLAKDIELDKFSSRTAFLSVDYVGYPTGAVRENFIKALKKRGSECLFFYPERALDADMLAQMAQCDRIIISGFLNPEWVAAVKSLGKPVVQLGFASLETDLCKVAYDYEHAFRTIFKHFQGEGYSRFAAILPHPETTCEAKHIIACYHTAAAKAGVEVKPQLAQCMPKKFPIAWCSDFIRRNQHEFEVLLMGPIALNLIMFDRHWGSYTVGKPLVIYTGSVPEDFDTVPDMYRVSTDESMLDKALEVLFDYPHSFIERGEVAMMKSDMARNQSYKTSIDVMNEII